MKKLLYVFLAMTVAFAMVACSNSSTDTGGGGPTYVTVTYSLGVAGGTTLTGTAPTAVSVVQNTGRLTTAQLPNPTTGVTNLPAGYEFVNWVLSGTSTQVTTSTSFAAATTIVATWRNPNTDATVLFKDGYSGATLYTITVPDAKVTTGGVAIGATAWAAITDPVRTDEDYYDFVEWVLEDDDEVVVDEDTLFEDDTTVLATWVEDSVVITFEVDPVDFEDFTPAIAASVKIRTGGALGAKFPGVLTSTDFFTVFEDWYEDDGTTVVTAASTFDDDATITAKFVPDTRGAIQFIFEIDPVSFTDYVVVGGGTLPAANELKIRDGQSLGSKLPRLNIAAGVLAYKFDGWYDGSTKVTGASTFSNPTSGTFVSKTLTGKFVADDRLVINFFATEEDFTGGEDPIKIVRLTADQSFTAEGAKLPVTPNRGFDYFFHEWIEAVSETAVTAASSFPDAGQPINVYGTWYDGRFTAADAAQALEKVYNEDTGLPVYEFNISSLVTGGDTVADILAALESIEGTYMVNEAGLLGAPRLRAFGPYFYNGDDVITLTTAQANNPIGTSFFGDFKIDPNGKPVARLDGTATPPEEFNKFQSYLLSAAGDSWGTSTPTKDTWFTRAVDLTTADDDGIAGSGGYGIAKTLRLLGDDFFVDGTVNGVQVVPATTDFTKVYFAVGLMRANAGTVINTTDSIWSHGKAYLVKDVKLTLGDGTEINGTVPNLSYPAHDYYQSATTTIEIEAGTSNQVFVGYVNPVLGGWRGAYNAEIVIQHGPGWTPPEYPDADEDLEIEFPEVTLLGDSKTKDGGRTVATLVDGVFTVNATVDDYNNGGDWGGAGISISLPENYTAYASIKVYYETSDFVDGSTGTSNTAQFVVGGGTNGFNSTGGYHEIADGEGLITFSAKANLGSGATSGFNIRANNWGSETVPVSYSVVITKIVLEAP